MHSYWTDWCRARKYIGELELISLAVTLFRVSIKRWYMKENSFEKMILKRFLMTFIKNLRNNYSFEGNNLSIDVKRALCNNNVNAPTSVLDMFTRVYKLQDLIPSTDEVTVCWQCSWRRYGRLPTTRSASKRFRYQAGFTCCKLNDRSFRNSPSLASRDVRTIDQDTQCVIP